MNPSSPFASQPRREHGGSPSDSGARYDTNYPPLDTPAPLSGSGSKSRPATVLVFQPGAEAVTGYHLVRLLGRGGFGEVWEATGPGGFPLALKFVTLHGSGSHIELRSLEVMKTIRHPHLLGLFGAWKTQDYLIVAMELGEKTLKDRLEEYTARGLPGVPPAELIEYMREAAKGIDYLNDPIHRLGDGPPQGIQHRDIKPQNLLLVGGSVKVADFGLAKLLEKSVESASGSMSPAYAAPEFCSGQATRWSDQYSLAVAYCQLRGNRLPFTGNLAQLVAGHLSQAPDLSMIPVAKEREVLARALLKQPSARWPTCREFVEALALALGITRPGSSTNLMLPDPEPLDSIDMVTTVPPPLPPRHPAPGTTSSHQRSGSRTAHMTTPPPLPRTPPPPMVEEVSGGNGLRITLFALAALLLFGVGAAITFVLLWDKPGSPVAVNTSKKEGDAPPAPDSKNNKEEQDKQDKAAEEARRKIEKEKQQWAEERKRLEEEKQRLAQKAEEEQRAREALEKSKQDAERQAALERMKQRQRENEDRRKQDEERVAAERRAREARQEAALKYKAVTQIGNRCPDTVYFAIRWKLYDDTWTDWQEDSVEPEKTWIYHRRGARSGEIRYHRSASDERTHSLQFVQMDHEADVKTAKSPHQHFWSDGTYRQFDVTDEVEEAARLKFRAVVVVANPTKKSTSGHIAYKIRWRRCDGHTWTKWADFKVDNEYNYTHSLPGATGCQIEFDCIGGDDKYTPKTYDLEFNNIPIGREAKPEDGKRYYFDYKDESNIDLFKK
jgi:serine/threonine protein kinase